jgi:hypothetical protein
MVYSGRGFVTWFEIFIYNKIRKACKNTIIKIFVHSLGLIFMIVGIYYLFATIPSFTSIFGMFLSFVGFVVFLIPLSVEKE